MKDRPIPIRLDVNTIEKLEKICKEENTNKSRLCNEIIVEYIKYYRHAKKNKDLLVPKNTIQVLYNSLDETKIEHVIDEISTYAVEKIESATNSITYELVEDTLTRWFAASHLELVVEEIENNIFRFRCKHELDKKWSFVVCNVLIIIFQDLEINIKVQDKRIGKHFFYLDVFVF